METTTPQVHDVTRRRANSHHPFKRFKTFTDWSKVEALLAKNGSYEYRVVSRVASHGGES